MSGLDGFFYGVMVNVTLLLVPPGGVVVWTFRLLVFAPAVMAKVAVTVLSSTTTTLLTVTPAPDTTTPVVPVRP